MSRPPHFKMSAGLSAAALLTLLFSAAPADAGQVWTMNVTDHIGGQETVQELRVERKNLKMTIASGGGGDDGGQLIFRGDRRELLFLDPASRTFMQMDEKTARELGDRFGDVDAQRGVANQQLQDRLSTLDPDQRAKLEQYLGGGSGGGGNLFGGASGALRLEKSSTRGEHGGYPTVRWDAFRGDEKFMEMWVTDWSKLKGGAEVRRAFEDLGQFWGDLTEAGMPSEDFEFLEAMTTVDGFSVLTRTFEQGRLAEEIALLKTELKRQELSEFEPTGFTRRSMMVGF